MGYVESNLGTGERIEYRGDVHWAIGLPYFVLGGILLPGGQETMAVAIPLLVIGFLRIIIARLMYEYAVTNKRVVVKRGFIFRDTVEINLNKVESASVNQGILGRILGYGTVIVRGSGGTAGKCKYISNPTHFRQVLNQAIEGDLPEPGTLAGAE